MALLSAMNKQTGEVASTISVNGELLFFLIVTSITVIIVILIAWSLINLIDEKKRYYRNLNKKIEGEKNGAS